MDPRSKFVTPQPAAPSYADLSTRRTGTAAPTLSINSASSKESSPISPIKSPWRRFFHKTIISRSLENRDRSVNRDDHRSLTPASSNYDIRPETSSEGTRTRDISPTSLHRLLVEDTEMSMRPVSRGSLTLSTQSRTPTLNVLDQVDEDDDDNFVGVAEALSLYTAEEPLFITRLSPPPFRRGTSPATATSSSAQTVVQSPQSPQHALQTGQDVATDVLISPVPQHPDMQRPMPESPTLSVKNSSLPSETPSSTVSSLLNSPTSPASSEFPALCGFPTLDEFPSLCEFPTSDEFHALCELPTSAELPALCEVPASGEASSCCDDSQDDDDSDQRFTLSDQEEMPASHSTEEVSKHAKAPSTASFSRYRLPHLAFSTDKLPTIESNNLAPCPRFATIHSPMLLPQPGEPVGDNDGSNLLGSSLIGLDDFGRELSWLADSITSRPRS
ncbi:hypothetical protein V2A60_002746 [Cordyceps javanica]|uniref:Uncharacterized protein n=1 Tax=Cordyceps javanica TaxID=43265 RepID=A0A545VWJ0_9HYPO|nr:hypothetical protein IF1G_07090 [Cordyceps javanica]TQW06088.1 hypothetical protein IF2G_06371 [Cordyceps javanica]